MGPLSFFPLVFTFEPFHHGGLRSIKFLVTLQISRLEIDGKLQMATMQTGIGAYPSPAAHHSIFEGAPARIELQIVFGSHQLGTCTSTRWIVSPAGSTQKAHSPSTRKIEVRTSTAFLSLRDDCGVFQRITDFQRGSISSELGFRTSAALQPASTITRKIILASSISVASRYCSGAIYETASNKINLWMAELTKGILILP